MITSNNEKGKGNRENKNKGLFFMAAPLRGRGREGKSRNLKISFFFLLLSFFLSSFSFQPFFFLFEILVGGICWVKAVSWGGGEALEPRPPLFFIENLLY